MSATPLLLLHGFPFDSTLWAPVRALLPPGLPVYAPDLPGFGTEPPLPTPTTEALADWLAGWLAARGVGPVAVAGHSMGGYVALAFAERHRGQVRGLGLVHATAAPDTPEKRASRGEQLAHLAAYGTAQLVDKLITPLVAAAHAPRLHAVLAAYVTKAAALPAATLAGSIGAMRARPDRTSVLREADFPVWFVAGAHDPVLPLAAAMAQHQLTPPGSAAQLEVLPDAGHLGMLEAPAAVAAALTALARASHIDVDSTRFEGGRVP